MLINMRVKIVLEHDQKHKNYILSVSSKDREVFKQNDTGKSVNKYQIINKSEDLERKEQLATDKQNLSLKLNYQVSKSDHINQDNKEPGLKVTPRGLKTGFSKHYDFKQF